eukprot:439946-Prorocentrum_minimum.AAC.1
MENSRNFGGGIEFSGGVGGVGKGADVPVPSVAHLETQQPHGAPRSRVLRAGPARDLRRQRVRARSDGHHRAALDQWGAHAAEAGDGCAGRRLRLPENRQVPAGVAAQVSPNNRSTYVSVSLSADPGSRRGREWLLAARAAMEGASSGR